MSHPPSLGLHDGVGAIQLLAGLALWLGVGWVWTRRWLGRNGWLAPPMAFALFSTTAILLDVALDIPITPVVTWTMGLALLIVGSRPWATDGWRLQVRWSHLAIFAAVAFVAAAPHLPATGGGVAAVAGVPWQIWDGLQGGNPYPIHVDEHIHIARATAVDRQETAWFDDPYTGVPADVGSFSLRGSVHERGFWVGLAQMHQLLGVSVATLARFVPALWAGAAGAALAVQTGRWQAGVATAAVPTSILFLGPGFLAPIGFGLPWLILVVEVMRAKQPKLGPLLLLVTSAFFVHLTIGAGCMVAAVVGALLRDGEWRDRLPLAGSAMLPLIWVGPGVWHEVQPQLAAQAAHPWQPEILASAGWIWSALMALGLVVAWRGRSLDRTYAALAIVCLALMGIASWNQTNSLTLYYRLVPILFFVAAALLGTAVAWVGRALPRPAVLAIFLIGAPFMLASHAQPVYHIFDDETWHAGEILYDAGAAEGDVFLSHPWHAPMYNAMTGATPHAVLYPGGEPLGQADWNTYLDTEGANAQWLAERGIRYVVSGVPPKAPFEELGGGVFRLT